MSNTEKPIVSADSLPYRPCVGIMVLNPAGRIWVGQRADAPGDAEGRGTWWQMPQGGVDPDEQPAEAALRELREETGVTSVEVIGEHADWLTYELPENLLGIALKGRYRGQRQKWFAMRFLGDDSEIDIAPKGATKAEFNAWRWAPIESVPKLIIPFKRDVYERVTSAFGHLTG